jgi:hypothetical protein
MTNRKSKPKAGTRPVARKADKSTLQAQSIAGSRKGVARGTAHPDTKHARIIAMLRAPAGATIAAIVMATEWQPHSVRDFLAGVVRKKLRLNLVAEQTDKGRVYRIRDGKVSSVAADRTRQAA